MVSQQPWPISCLIKRLCTECVESWLCTRPYPKQKLSVWLGLCGTLWAYPVNDSAAYVPALAKHPVIRLVSIQCAGECLPLTCHHHPPKNVHMRDLGTCRWKIPRGICSALPMLLSKNQTVSPGIVSQSGVCTSVVEFCRTVRLGN